MQKDLKIGFFVGLAIVAAASFWLATRSELATEARLLRSQKVISTRRSTPKQTYAEPVAEQKIPDYKINWQTEKIKTTKFHIVSTGETLSAISAKYYGTAGNWQKILDANKDVIKKPDKLTAGTKLVIPQ